MIALSSRPSWRSEVSLRAAACVLADPLCGGVLYVAAPIIGTKSIFGAKTSGARVGLTLLLAPDSFASRLDFQEGGRVVPNCV